MACRNCGSDWRTTRGYDCLRCPHCCKMSRHKARRAGRWVEPSVAKTCERCRSAFAVTGLHHIAMRRFCDSCARIAKAEWRRQYAKEYRRGNGQRRGREECNGRASCNTCGIEFKKKRATSKYCSKRCFFAARSSGLQPWDRSRIHAASLEHGAIRSAKGIGRTVSRLSSDWRRQLADARTWMVVQCSMRQCRKCGKCFDGRAGRGDRRAYCGRRCAIAARLTKPCVKCGKETKCNALCRNPKCRRCRVGIRESNHRQRCRRLGLPYERGLTHRWVCERDRFVCHICGRKTNARAHWNHPRYPTVDHVVPLAARVYGHVTFNVRCACRVCNERKAAGWDGQLLLPAATG